MRRAFAEVTLAWAGLFAFRALVYLVLISAGKAGWLAVASVAMGWPAFLLAVFFSYRYVPWRLAQLGAPPRPEAGSRELGGRHRPPGRQVEGPQRFPARERNRSRATSAAARADTFACR